MLVTATSQNTFVPQAEIIAKQRYYLRDEANDILEDSTDLFQRVAQAIAAVEDDFYTLSVEKHLVEQDFYSLMSSHAFLPNSPTLMNAGTEQGTLSACFVLPLEDSMESIMKAATDSALVQKFGGGTGFALSKICLISSFERGNFSSLISLGYRIDFISKELSLIPR